MTQAQRSLFDDGDTATELHAGLLLLRGLADTALLAREIERITSVSPTRQLEVPSGGRTSVAMTNCGALGWTSDSKGYRYTPSDPLTGQPWPAMPAAFMALARSAATKAGFPAFAPDVCLINRYVPGARLGLHRDAGEVHHDHPIVSVSIGASATFLWGGLRRSDPVHRLALHDGDVLVWGGPARLTFHGVAPLLAPDPHAVRFNLTFRRAG